MVSTGGPEVTIPSKLVHTLNAHQGPVNVVRYNHGAKYILSGSSDRSIRLWNASAGKQIKVYQGHAHEVLALDITHDNAKFASAGGDKIVFVWDVASGQIVRRLQGHFGKINALAFNTDAQVLATAGFDAKIMLWDMRAAARDPLQTIKDASSSITSMSILSSTLYTASLDGHIRTYDLRLGKMIEDLVGHPLTSLAQSKIGDTVLVASTDGKIRIFDTANGSCLQTLEGHKVGQTRTKAVWGYGEASVVAGDEEGKIWAWNVLEGKPISSGPLSAHKRAVTWVEVSPNGKEMVSASLDGTIKVWHQ